MAVKLRHLVTQALLGNIYQEDSFRARGSWDELVLDQSELDLLDNELRESLLGRIPLDGEYKEAATAHSFSFIVSISSNMQQIQALQKESTLEKEKSIKYRGTARIQLEWLHFGEKQLDIKHVQDLQSRFQKDCRRLDARNHVPALIDEQHLVSALRVSGISEGVLLMNPQHDFPELGFWPGYRLECLHGRHRIQAAKHALLPPDKWWTVDLYLAGRINHLCPRCILTGPIDISSELKTTLTEEYANEGQPSDGEVYRKIREYHFQNQFSLETRWWTRLSTHRTTNLKQLLHHKDIAAAFDSLLEIPALLEGMRISTLHKMFATRCDEVSVFPTPLGCAN